MVLWLAPLFPRLSQLLLPLVLLLLLLPRGQWWIQLILHLCHRTSLQHLAQCSVLPMNLL